MAVNFDDLNATLITPVKQIEQSLATPETTQNLSKSKVATATSSTSSSPGPSNVSISYFDPTAMSTPARVNGQMVSTVRLETAEQSQQQQQQSDSFNSFDSTLLAPPISPSIPSVNNGSTLNSPQFVYQYPTNANLPTVSSESNLPILISIPQYQMQPIMINMSSDPKTTSTTENTSEIDQLKRQIQSGPVSKKRGYRDKRSRFKSAAYVELENLDPNTIQPKVRPILDICIHFPRVDTRTIVFLL